MKVALLAVLAVSVSSAALADYRLELAGKGMEDYYCSITVRLTNMTEDPVTEVNGYFQSFVGKEDVGRSRGASFLNIAPGASAEATFLTPNAPCDEVSAYEFVVGACRFDASFADTGECAARIAPEAPITEAAPR